MTPLEQIKTNSCKCITCRKMCERPCWGRPEDIQKIIDAGFGDRLSKDYWTEEGGEVLIISPALKGHESKEAPFTPISEEGCTFLKDGLCELHDLGLKPLEGKIASCKKNTSTKEKVHERIKETWDSAEGKALAKKWCDEKNVPL